MSRRRYLPAFVAAGLIGLAATMTAGQRQSELKIPGQPPAAPSPAALQNYQSVTADRLKNPADGNSGVYAPATSFTIDGRQHIAVVSGWGMDPRSTQAHLNRASPGNFPEVPEGGVIWVFALDDK